MSRDNSTDPTPYAVICNHGCGLQFLNHSDYNRQMDRPDSFWLCPICSLSAEWDDDCQISNPPEEDPPWDLEELAATILEVADYLNDACNNQTEIVGSMCIDKLMSVHGSLLEMTDTGTLPTTT